MLERLVFSNSDYKTKRKFKHQCDKCESLIDICMGIRLKVSVLEPCTNVKLGKKTT